MGLWFLGTQVLPLQTFKNFFFPLIFSSISSGLRVTDLRSNPGSGMRVQNCSHLYLKFTTVFINFIENKQLILRLCLLLDMTQKHVKFPSTTTICSSFVRTSITKTMHSLYTSLKVFKEAQRGKQKLLLTHCMEISTC